MVPAAVRRCRWATGGARRRRFRVPRWPEGFGGRGLSGRDAKAVRRLAPWGAYGPRAASPPSSSPGLLVMGTPEQRQRYLPGIVDGTTPWCQLFSEPTAGSDLASLGTRGRMAMSGPSPGRRYGTRALTMRSTGLIARTDPDAPKHRGVTYFLIDMTQPGVEVQPLREMTGDAAFNEVFFDDARVHDWTGSVLTARAAIAMTTLSFEHDPATPASATPPRSTKPTSRCRW